MTDPLRVALLTYSTRPRGGVVHTLALAEALAALGQHVDIWSLARGGDAGFFRAVDPAVRVRLVPFPDIDNEAVGARIMRSIGALRAAFSPEAASYDVVHAQDCISANAVPHCIRTIHHLDTFTTPELAACHERAIVEPIGHICVSAAVAAEVHAGWGLQPTVIPNGVAAEPFRAAAAPTRAAAESRSRWTKSLGSYVLNVGGIEPRKGTADLVEAMALVQGQRPGLRLVIAGGETLFDYRDYRTDVLRRAATLGVDLEIVGTIDNADLPSLVAAASVFAFPSVKEGFGIAALEAMAANIPVVMRDLPVLREIFNGAAAFVGSVEELAAAIVAAVDAGRASHAHRQRHETRRQIGQTLVDRYTWTAAAHAHLDFYRDLTLRTSPVA